MTVKRTRRRIPRTPPIAAPVATPSPGSVEAPPSAWASLLHHATSSRPGGPLTSQPGLLWHGDRWLSCYALGGTVYVLDWLAGKATPIVAGRDPCLYAGPDGSPWLAYVGRVSGAEYVVTHAVGGSVSYPLAAVGPGSALPSGSGSVVALVSAAEQGTTGTLGVYVYDGETYRLVYSDTDATGPSVVEGATGHAVVYRYQPSGLVASAVVARYDGRDCDESPAEEIVHAYDPCAAIGPDASLLVASHTGYATVQIGREEVAAGAKFASLTTGKGSDGRWRRALTWGSYGDRGTAQLSPSESQASRSAPVRIDVWDGAAWVLEYEGTPIEGGDRGPGHVAISPSGELALCVRSADGLRLVTRMF